MRIAKKHAILTFLLTYLLVSVCATSSILAVSDGKTLEDITVGVPVDRCPIFYQDADTKEITGIGIDLMRAAAEEAGYNANFRIIEEANLKDALDNEEYDIVMPFGSAVSSTSGQTTIVSDNLFQTPFTLVTLKSRNLPPFNRLNVGMLHSLSGAAETVTHMHPGIQIHFYETMYESVSALRAGRVDALLHNSYVWSYVLQKPSYSDLSVQPLAMFSMDFRAGTKDTPSGRVMIERLNNGISKITDTKRQAIILDFTSRKLYRYSFWDYIYKYGMFMFMGLLLGIAIVAIIVLRWRTLKLEQEEKMRKLIDHDPLTGAYSINGFRKRAEELLRDHKDTPYVMIYTNIRNFKFINDSLGMGAGDELLRFWAERLLEYLSDEDAVSRIEADHFAILCRMGGDEQVAMVEKKVFDPVRNYFASRNNDIRVQICTGVYVITSADHWHINVDHFLDFARMAEKKVREEHKEGYKFYNPKQWVFGKLAADVVSYLPVAIKNGETQVWYQPQVNYETGRIIGAEALCRWDHAKRGWISPAEFIPALEEAGLIYDLDCFVWDTVCRDLRRWNEQGSHRALSVNLSRADFADDRNIPDHFKELIDTYGLTPDQLHVEITETAYVENPELLINTTNKLREYGFRVEMDDFGSGYSSLNMLKEVSVDRIKLDLRFLTETGDPEKGHIIIDHVISMAKALGMDIIAEGVEQEEQARFLKELGCLEMQGFYFHKPMPSKDFEGLFDKEKEDQ